MSLKDILPEYLYNRSPGISIYLLNLFDSYLITQILFIEMIRFETPLIYHQHPLSLWALTREEMKSGTHSKT